jgi:hypothetical protein
LTFFQLSSLSNGKVNDHPVLRARTSWVVKWVLINLNKLRTAIEIDPGMSFDYEQHIFSCSWI